jgi:hypothetical protein
MISANVCRIPMPPPLMRVSVQFPSPIISLILVSFELPKPVSRLDVFLLNSGTEAGYTHAPVHQASRVATADWHSGQTVTAIMYLVCLSLSVNMTASSLRAPEASQTQPQHQTRLFSTVHSRTSHTNVPNGCVTLASKGSNRSKLYI